MTIERNLILKRAELDGAERTIKVEFWIWDEGTNAPRGDFTAVFPYDNDDREIIDQITKHFLKRTAEKLGIVDEPDGFQPTGSEFEPDDQRGRTT